MRTLRLACSLPGCNNIIRRQIHNTTTLLLLLLHVHAGADAAGFERRGNAGAVGVMHTLRRRRACGRRQLRSAAHQCTTLIVDGRTHATDTHTHAKGQSATLNREQQMSVKRTLLEVASSYRRQPSDLIHQHH